MEVAVPLAYLINMSLEVDYFPNQSKHALVRPSLQEQNASR